MYLEKLLIVHQTAAIGRHAAALELWTRLVESGLCVGILPEVLSGVFWVQSCDETVPFRPGQRERERERRSY